jgi:hypothetical protein
MAEERENLDSLLEMARRGDVEALSGAIRRLVRFPHPLDIVNDAIDDLLRFASTTGDEDGQWILGELVKSIWRWLEDNGERYRYTWEDYLEPWPDWHSLAYEWYDIWREVLALVLQPEQDESREVAREMQFRALSPIGALGMWFWLLRLLGEKRSYEFSLKLSVVLRRLIRQIASIETGHWKAIAFLSASSLVGPTYLVEAAYPDTEYPDRALSWLEGAVRDMEEVIGDQAKADAIYGNLPWAWGAPPPPEEGPTPEPPPAPPPPGVRVVRGLVGWLRGLVRREELKAAEPEPWEEGEARYANMALVDVQTALPLGKDYLMKPGDETVLRVDIGPLSPDTLIRKPGEFPEELLPEDSDGHWIDVMLSSTEFELADGSTASGRLFLPKDKRRARTEDGRIYLHFSMRAPSTKGWAYARVGFYHTNNLLQSYRLVADVGGVTPVYVDEEPDFKLSETMADVTRLKRRGLTILTNDNMDGSHQLVLRGEGMTHKVAATFRLNSDAVGEAVREMRKTLKKIAPTEEERTKKQLIEDMERLAPLGYKLWVHIMGQIEDQSFELDDLLQEGKYPVIQVARPDTAGYVFPWGLLYDIPIDSGRELTECPIIEKWREGEAMVVEGTRRCPEVLKSGKPHKSNTLCPFGFWGYRYAIEQLSSTKSLVTEIPAPTGNIEMVAALTQYKVDTKMLNEHITWLQGNLSEIVMRVGDTRDEIKEHLHDPDLHLVYFYCHGNYPDRTSGDTYLGIGNKETLTGPDFESWRTEWWRQERIKVWDKIRPLIFINACHSVDIEPDSLVSLLKAFVGRASAAGVIGTEVRVNQQLAIQVAEIFFDEFVNKGTEVSQVLHKIQLHFLSKGNLFGLVYTPYCSADLKLVRN